MQYQEELAEMQNDESVKTLFNIKGSMAWFFKRPKLNIQAQQNVEENCYYRFFLHI